MQAIYTRTMRVKDDGLGKAMEICQGLAKVRKKYYPKHQIYFSFQIGGDPRTIRETLIGTMFEDLLKELLKTKSESSLVNKPNN